MDSYNRARSSATWFPFSDDSLRAFTPCASLTDTASVSGIGADLSQVLYWLGKQAIGAALSISIRRRLAAINTFISNRPAIRRLVGHDIFMQQLHDVCEDLLEFYAYSIIVIKSGFPDVLASCGLDQSQDPRILYPAAQLARIIKAYKDLSCDCSICLNYHNVGKSTSADSITDVS
ncbi:hypothetical protein PC9H_003431 [Pleurotus ostreatus]|uniref:Uncharacterized protein n=1 Tax=Pleurotus ostreatus TaxID=5322 RepID=A0A8H7DWG6_PLEOS|nr:uncharacterized protein PC9H_003431 [Pleurotus ostreatus]KAF7436598.1 hypothetical protein PC9H_003431 [Pleurotus ostreatus]